MALTHPVIVAYRDVGRSTNMTGRSADKQVLFSALRARGPGSAMPADHKFPRLLRGPCQPKLGCRNAGSPEVPTQSRSLHPRTTPRPRSSPIFDLAFAKWLCVHNASVMLSVVKTIGHILLILHRWSVALDQLRVRSCDHDAPGRNCSFDIASWRLATWVIWPFGCCVVSRPGAGASGRSAILWFVLAGLWIAIGHVISGALLCCTIIGIPFGIVSFRLAGLALAALGKDIVKRGQEPVGVTVVVSA